jgi:hypothetical protein
MYHLGLESVRGRLESGSGCSKSVVGKVSRSKKRSLKPAMDDVRLCLADNLISEIYPHATTFRCSAQSKTDHQIYDLLNKPPNDLPLFSGASKARR